MQDIDFDNSGHLYAIRNFFGANESYRIDPDTGEATLLSDSLGGSFWSLAYNKTTGQFVFRDIAVGQTDLYGLAFNSTGTLFGFKKTTSPTSTQVYVIQLPTSVPYPSMVASSLTATIPKVFGIRSVLALPPTFANCLQTTGAAGPLLLSNMNATLMRYSKTAGIVVVVVRRRRRRRLCSPHH